MRPDEVPPGWRAYQCQSCGDVLALAPDASTLERFQASREHVIYLCTAPSAAARAARAAVVARDEVQRIIDDRRRRGL